MQPFEIVDADIRWLTSIAHYPPCWRDVAVNPEQLVRIFDAVCADADGDGSPRLLRYRAWTVMRSIAPFMARIPDDVVDCAVRAIDFARAHAAFTVRDMADCAVFVLDHVRPRDRVATALRARPLCEASEKLLRFSAENELHIACRLQLVHVASALCQARPALMWQRGTYMRLAEEQALEQVARACPEPADRNVAVARMFRRAGVLATLIARVPAVKIDVWRELASFL